MFSKILFCKIFQFAQVAGMFNQAPGENLINFLDLSINRFSAEFSLKIVGLEKNISFSKIIGNY